MEHFNPVVSIEVQNHVKNFAEYVLENFISEFKESNACSNIDEILGIDASGWIPFQYGGYTITEFYHNDIDSSYHFIDSQTEFNNKAYDDFLKQYASDNEIEVSAIDYDDYVFQSVEGDLYDSALLRFCVYVTNDNKINMEFSVNYKDMPYYRLKSDTMLKEKSLSIDDFLQCDFDAILTEFKNYK